MRDPAGLRPKSRETYATLLAALALGGAGLWLGARMDFGAVGLAALADLCATSRASLPDTRFYRIGAAPWSHVGMLAGCTAGLLLVGRFPARRPRDCSALGVRLLACNAGMLVGMSVVELLSPASWPVLGRVAVTTRMFLIMMLGMGIGMWLAGSTLDLILRLRRSLAALRGAAFHGHAAVASAHPRPGSGLSGETMRVYSVAPVERELFPNS